MKQNKQENVNAEKERAKEIKNGWSLVIDMPPPLFINPSRAQVDGGYIRSK